MRKKINAKNPKYKFHIPLNTLVASKNIKNRNNDKFSKKKID